MPFNNFIKDTTRPDYRLESLGRHLSKVEVTSLSVTHSANRISTAQIIIVDGDAAAGNFPQAQMLELQPGRELTVKLGYGDQFETVFTGVVVSHNVKVFRNKPSVFILELKHQAIRLAHNRQNKVYTNKSDADIASAIQRAHQRPGTSSSSGFGGFETFQLPDLSGLVEAEVSKPLKIKWKNEGGDANAETITHDQRVQYNISDWDFLVMRAEANGRLVYTTKEGVEIKSPEINPNAAQVISFGDNVFDFDGLLDSRTQFEGVQGNFWDYSKQAIISVKSQASDLAGLPESGKFSMASLAKNLDQGQFNLVHSGIAQESEFKNWAKAALQRVRLSKIRGKVTLQGISDIEPGSTVTLKGFGSALDGNAFISGIRHKLVPGNWFTEVEFGIRPDCFARLHDVMDEPVSGLSSPMQGLQIGIVTKNVDPEKLHRVQVRLPYMGEDKMVWARVLQKDAGKEHGVFFHPQIDDEVIVGFLNQDPNSPIVMGGLVNTDQNTPPFGNADLKNQGVLTKNGLRVELNDTDKSITISTPGDQKLLLSDKDGEKGIALTDSYGNKILMDKNGITIESAKSDIKVKAAVGGVNISGMDVEANGTSSFTGKGGVASLEGTGSAMIGGPTINIG